MTYTFPDGLRELRDWMRAQGADVKSFSTERQAAFVAQNLANQRFKFPADRTASLFPLMRKLQDIVCHGAAGKRPVPKAPVFDASVTRKAPSAPPAVTPVSAPGLAIYCDGSCEPNPGEGGWGFAVYRDGVEVAFGCGGKTVTTNNQMELTGLLMSAAWVTANAPSEPVVIFCDSKYVVDGINSWVSKWKAHGWKRKGSKAAPGNRAIANLDLWQILDKSIEPLAHIKVEWIKGHAGHVGNERADELSLIGREEVKYPDIEQGVA